jgi:hypothetical protein
MAKERLAMAQSSPLSLQNKHSRLQDNIAQEMQRPSPNELLIQRWKKEKLHIKEALSGL